MEHSTKRGALCDGRGCARVELAPTLGVNLHKVHLKPSYAIRRAQGHPGGEVPAAELSVETLGFNSSPVTTFPLFLLTLSVLFDLSEAQFCHL